VKIHIPLSKRHRGFIATNTQHSWWFDYSTNTWYNRALFWSSALCKTAFYHLYKGFYYTFL